MNIKQPQKNPQEQNNHQPPQQRQYDLFLITRYPVCWLIILIHPFLLFPTHFYPRRTVGKKEGTFEFPRFVDLDQGQCPRQTWNDWFPSEIWQFHPHSNDKLRFMPFKALWDVWLHLIFTLGVSRRSGLVFTLAQEQTEHKNLPSSHTVSRGKRKNLMSHLLAWGSFHRIPLPAQMLG